METLIRIQRVRRTAFDFVTGGAVGITAEDLSGYFLNPNTNIRYTWSNQPASLTFDVSRGALIYSNNTGTSTLPSGANVNWSVIPDNDFYKYANTVTSADSRGFGYSHYKNEQPPLFTVSGDIEWWNRTQHSGGLDDDDDFARAAT